MYTHQIHVQAVAIAEPGFVRWPAFQQPPIAHQSNRSDLGRFRFSDKRRSEPCAQDMPGDIFFGVVQSLAPCFFRSMRFRVQSCVAPPAPPLWAEVKRATTQQQLLQSMINAVAKMPAPRA